MIFWHTADHFIAKNARSIRQDGVNLRGYCKANNIQCTTNEADHHEYKQFITGLLAGEERPVQRPEPVTASDLLAIIKVINPDNQHDRQLWLMVLVARNGLLRAGELCGTKLKRKHLHREAGGAWRIDLLKTKTTRLSADSNPIWILPAEPSSRLSERQNLLLDAASLLTTYVARTKLDTTTPLFPKLDARGQPAQPQQGIDYRIWLKQFKFLCKRAGIKPRSLHALRAGGATDLYIQGVPEAMVKKAGRWVSNSTSSQLYNRPGMAITAMVQRAHTAEITAAATKAGRRR